MKHTVVIKNRPIRSGTESIPDGALCGNGDIGVILGNSDGGLRIHMSKVDFWCGGEYCDDGGGIKAVGSIDFNVPDRLYRNYHVEQRMDTAEIYCHFADGETFIDFTIAVCAVSRNILIKVSFSPDYIFSEPEFKPFYGDKGISKAYVFNGINAFSREFSDGKLCFKTKLVAGLREIINDANEKSYIVSMDTNFDCENFEHAGLNKLSKINKYDFDVLYSRHLEWWKEFYSKSSMKIEDDELEMNWYASQYILGICSRNLQFPPGIYGNFITIDNVNWKGDYHLNYNYQASFYGSCSSNHVELTDCYPAPLLDFIERGKKCASEYLRMNGVFYPVGMGPKGMFSEYKSGYENWERMYLGQKSNAIHSTDIMIMRWNATRDTDYAREVAYPFFKQVAAFWENYLVKEKGNYVVIKDSINEVPYYRNKFNPKQFKKVINDKNSLLTLGLLRSFFTCIIDMSEELNIDDIRRKEWQEILENLSDFPTFIKKGKRVFRYTSKGQAWSNTNSLCIQHIYPCGQIGLSSDNKQLRIARNTFFMNNRWFDNNGTNSIFPCAARLGISPKLIIDRLKENYKRFLLDNMLFLHEGGCLENSSITSATLNEMVMQSYDGVIRVFPVWDKSINCTFTNLRADGAFLVSSAIVNGEIQYINIFSERNSKVVIKNPYDKAEITQNGIVKYIADRNIIVEIKMDMSIRIERAS